MCGLVAVVTKAYNGFSVRDKDVFSQMLFADTLRGDDATGVMLVDNNGDLDLAKEATLAPWFQNTQEYKNLEVKAVRNGAAFIGHNRKATRGEIKDENAHPFVVDNRIVLVHNGTLYGDHKKIADTEVDSHAIAHLIHEKGDDVEAALSELNGAYALIWYDVLNRKLNFVRNDDRPLHYIETGSAWYFASEPGMLAWLLNRNNVFVPQGEKIHKLEADTLFEFTHNGRTWEAEQRKLALRKSVSSSAYYGDGLEEYYNAMAANSACSPPYTPSASKPHPYANGYMSGDDGLGEELGTLRQQRAQQHRTQLTVVGHPPSAASQAAQDTIKKYSMEISPTEKEMCRKAGMITSIDEFQMISRETPAGNWEKGRLIDYAYVRNGDPKNGLYMYAESTRFPNVCFRQFVQYDMNNLDFERDHIQMTMDEVPCMFKLSFKVWHKLEPGDCKDGITMVYTSEYGRISDAINEVNKEKHDEGCS